MFQRHTDHKAIILLRCLLAATYLFGGVAAWAVGPNLTTITPRGAARGTPVELTFHGGNLAGAVDLLFHDPGIRLVEPGEMQGGNFKCKVEISADFALGNHAIRVRTRSGISNLRLFSVGARNGFPRR